MIQNQILKQNHLQITECRLEILNVFLNSEIALSEEDIMLQVNKKFNKTSIYRTLNTFTEKGIIHKVITDLKQTKYSISQKNENLNHIHFECKKCYSIYCLNKTEINQPQLPEGFNNEEINVLILGICKKCNIF
jgi:Fur family ferric uptake transcriptional regulator